MEHFFYLSSSYLFCFQIQMTMASSFIRILFCVANIAHFLYVIYFRWGIRMEGDRYNTFGDETPLLHFASKFLPFLTYWNVLLQLFYFCVCLLDAIVGSKDKSKAKTPTSPLQRFRDFLFSTLAFPVSILVTTSFWAIYGVNRELIWPSFLDKIYPLWVNHMVHTTCMLSQVIEMTMVFHVFPTNKTGMTTTIGFYLTYLTWILYLAFNKGVWIYPILQKLPTIGRAIFIIVFGVVGCIIYFLGKTLNGMIWSRYVAYKQSSKHH